MKNLKAYKALFVVLIMFYTNHIMAQTNNEVPQAVATAFASKYPKAETKGWKVVNGLYTTKTNTENHKCTVTFDQNGNWISSTYKVNWPWHLPAAIKEGLHQTQYKNWNVYTVKIIEKPSGQFYEVKVDNRNNPADVFHQDLITETRWMQFTANGKLVKEANNAESASL